MKSSPTRSLLQSLRNNFLTGLIVVAPIGITLYITWTIVDYVDSQVLPQVLPLIPESYHPDQLLPFSLPGLGLVVFVVFLTFVGGLAKNFFGRELIRIGESWVDRMPVVRSVYNALKQITETIFAENGASFDKACLVQYPRRGIWAIAFVATETKGEVRERAVGSEEEMVSVFLPTTPNPTSGFLLFVPKEDVVLLDMTVEQAAKLVISGGLITPPHPSLGEQGEGAPDAADGVLAADGAAPPLGRGLSIEDAVAAEAAEEIAAAAQFGVEHPPAGEPRPKRRRPFSRRFR